VEQRTRSEIAATKAAAADLSCPVPPDAGDSPTEATPDPYWESAKRAPEWLGTAAQRRRLAEGDPQKWAALGKSHAQLLDSVVSRAHLDTFVAVCAVVHDRAILSAEDLYDLASPHNPTRIDLMVRYGYEIGLFALTRRPGRRPQKPGRQSYIVATAASDAYETKVRPRLSVDHHVAIMAGTAWTGSASNLQQHNLLANAFTRKAARLSGIQFGLGERLSSIALIGHRPLKESVDLRSAIRAAKSGDGLLVRTDGACIVIELTRNINAGFDRKVADWMRLLASYHCPAGLTVLFLVAPDPAVDGKAAYASSPARGRTLYTQVQRRILKVAYDHGPRTADAIATAFWPEWFPGPHQQSDAFAHLTADLLRSVGHGSEWVPTPLADVEGHPRLRPYNTSRSHDLDAILDNAGLLGCVPDWMQPAGRRSPPLIEFLMAEAGFSDYPTSEPAHVHTRPARQQHGSKRGAASGAAMPWRIPGNL
jgi:hypothetical protein